MSSFNGEDFLLKLNKMHDFLGKYFFLKEKNKQ